MPIMFMGDDRDIGVAGRRRLALGFVTGGRVGIEDPECRELSLKYERIPVCILSNVTPVLIPASIPIFQRAFDRSMTCC